MTPKVAGQGIGECVEEELDLAGCDAVTEPRQHCRRDAVAAGLRTGVLRGCTQQYGLVLHGLER